jgi:hypothetical protein
MSKKFFLVGAAVVTTLVLLFAACAQPAEIDGASLNINNFGVEPPRNVKATAYTGAVVITWDSPNAVPDGYRIQRQLKDSSEAPELIGVAANLRYVDIAFNGSNKLESGTYIYSVVSYANGDVGSVTAPSEGVEVTVTVPAKGAILPNPAAPTFEIVSSVPGSTVAGNLNFSYSYRISGLNPAYSYNFTIQSNDTPSITPYAWSYVSNSSISPNLSSSGYDGTYNGTILNVNRGVTTRVYRVLATVTANTSNPYNTNHGWVVADTAISGALDSSLANANVILVGTF